MRTSNLDVGANTTEINQVEYVIRGIGFIKSVDDLKNAVIKSVNGIPVTLGRVANFRRRSAGLHLDAGEPFPVDLVEISQIMMPCLI